jgi:hypothetical protein
MPWKNNESRADYSVSERSNLSINRIERPESSFLAFDILEVGFIHIGILEIQGLTPVPPFHLLVGRLPGPNRLENPIAKINDQCCKKQPKHTCLLYLFGT